MGSDGSCLTKTAGRAGLTLRAVGIGTNLLELNVIVAVLDFRPAIRVGVDQLLGGVNSEARFVVEAAQLGPFQREPLLGEGCDDAMISPHDEGARRDDVVQVDQFPTGLWLFHRST